VAHGVLALGLIAAMAQTMEDTTAAWGAVCLREELGAAAAVGGLGFIALQSTQTWAACSTTASSPATATAGWAARGPLWPASPWPPRSPRPASQARLSPSGSSAPASGRSFPAMRSADRLLPNGMGLMLVGTVLRVAIFVLPPVVGVVADAASLRAALLVIPVGALVVVVLARALSDGGR
jgi:hypothetical protein